MSVKGPQIRCAAGKLDKQLIGNLRRRIEVRASSSTGVEGEFARTYAEVGKAELGAQLGPRLSAHKLFAQAANGFQEKTLRIAVSSEIDSGK
jgi:hypothetical protein